MKKALEVGKSNLFMYFIGILLVGCIILLINACVQCKIPKEVVNHDVKSNAVPTVRTLILSNYSYKNRTYTNHFKSVPSKVIVSQVGLTQENAAAFKIKGIDAKKSIAIKDKDSSVYLQAYNYKYWMDQLPKILIYSLLILIFFATILIIFKFHPENRKI